MKIKMKKRDPSPMYRFDMPSCEVVRYNSNCIRLKQSKPTQQQQQNTFCWITM